MRTHALRFAFLALFLAGAPFALRRPDPPGLERAAGGRVALVGANVVDGTGAPARPNCTVLLDGERIAAVGEKVEVPEDAEVVDLAGATVLPGLIDMHGHLTADFGARMATVPRPYGRLYLAGGVTTVFSPGDAEPEAILAFRDAQRAGEEVGARVYCAGPFFDHGQGGRPWMLHVADPEEAVQELRAWEGRIDGVKVYTGVTEDILAAVLEEAHGAGLRVTGHLGATTATRAAELGIDRLEHGLFAMSEFGSPDPSNPFTLDYLWGVAEIDLDEGPGAELLARLLEKGVVLDPTIVILEVLLLGSEDAAPDWERYVAPDVLPLVRGFRDALAGLRASAPDGSEEVEEAAHAFLDKQYELVRRFHAAGGKVVGGTDPVFVQALPGYGLQREVEHLVRAGLTELEAIRACTLDAAEALGIEHELGSLEPGKLADLVVVDGDPTKDVRALRNTLAVYQAGARYSPEALRASAVGQIR